MLMGDPLSLEPKPGKGGVDGLQITVPLELASQLKMMEHSKDRLRNTHSTDSPLDCDACMVSGYG